MIIGFNPGFSNFQESDIALSSRLSFKDALQIFHAY